LLNTSWDKGAELLRKTVNVLYGETVRRIDAALCRLGAVVSAHLLVVSHSCQLFEEHYITQFSCGKSLRYEIIT
jgi:hypothetical protein